jgi:hypothetical protein
VEFQCAQLAQHTTPEIRDRVATVVHALLSGHRDPARVQLDVGMEQGGSCRRITAIERGEDLAHDLHILLRHLPRSISRQD